MAYANRTSRQEGQDHEEDRPPSRVHAMQDREPPPKAETKELMLTLIRSTNCPSSAAR